MVSRKRLKSLPRGNTSAGVNLSVIDHLQRIYGDGSQRSLFDIPCGTGEFLNVVDKLFPQWSTVGADIQAGFAVDRTTFVQIDASDPDEFPINEKFDVITSISGVMEFDNTLAFLKNLKKILVPDGLLIVTNDNILTVRDRLLYLFFGRLGQYPFSTESGSSTWKIIPLQNMVRIIGDAGFSVETLKYVPVRQGDWLWAPIAATLFFVSKISHLFGQEDSFTRQAFSFRSYLSKHYILVCRLGKSDQLRLG